MRFNLVLRIYKNFIAIAREFLKKKLFSGKSFGGLVGINLAGL
jgi:hypothetical protein